MIKGLEDLNIRKQSIISPCGNKNRIVRDSFSGHFPHPPVYIEARHCFSKNLLVLKDTLQRCFFWLRNGSSYIE